MAARRGPRAYSNLAVSALSVRLWAEFAIKFCKIFYFFVHNRIAEDYKLFSRVFSRIS